MVTKIQTFGQYETPASLADIVLSFCLRSANDRILDPSCGSGAFLQRADRFFRWLEPDSEQDGQLWGIELDIEMAAQAQDSLPHAQIISRNFFEMRSLPGERFDAIVGNPPYTRSEWIDNVVAGSEGTKQLSIFGYELDGSEEQPIGDKGGGSRRHPHLDVLGRRAGLHAYFFVHGINFLSDGSRMGFVVPNNWLDVAYGKRLKRFLLEHFKILAIIESSVERWFKEARVNTCIVVLEKNSSSDERSGNYVQLVRITRQLADLVPFALEDPRRLPHLQRLAASMLTNDGNGEGFEKRTLSQRELNPADKWGATLRAPDVYRRQMQVIKLHPLGNWATISRGYTTGANPFFYMDEARLDQWPVESEYRHPLLKSLRKLQYRRISDEEVSHQVLLINPEADLAGTVAADYVAWGEKEGWNQRPTCAARRCWYCLPTLESAPLLISKGIWNRHFAVIADTGLHIDQQIYRVFLTTGVTTEVAAALLNCAWFALQLELHGRINFGEGVLWLAQYELEQILMPDPRYLSDFHLEALAQKMQALSQSKIKPVEEESGTLPWQELNETVFDIMGFTAQDRREIVASLLEMISGRQSKARVRIDG